MISLNDVLLAASNVPVDDPIAEMWGAMLRGGYTPIIVEYTGTLPITITANGNTLIDYRIYGNTVQDGTPTPENPIMPIGCGERTENLWDFSASTKGILQNDGSTDTNQNYSTSDYIPVTAGQSYKFRALSGYTQGRFVRVAWYNSDRQFVDWLNEVKIAPIGSVYTNSYTAPNDASYVRVSGYSYLDSEFMFVSGSTAPTSYIPYGYKLPMTVQSWNLFNGQGTDNYGYYNNSSGEYVNDRNYKYWRFPVKEGDIIRWTKADAGYGCTFLNGVRNGIIFSNSTPFTVPAGVDEITNNFHSRVWDSAMVTKNQPIPDQYVPYSHTDAPVYIGDTPLDAIGELSDYVDYASGKIVRKIAEYTFTGDESFNKYGNSDVFYTSKTIDPAGITTVNTITMRCNHSAFTAIENKDTRYWLNPEADNICCFLPGGMSQVFLRSTSNFTTAAECEAYLKAQYDNGTPVKISYWLKTPIEEDPPVSFPDIPTIKGETIIDYDGEPKPSQMYVKYKDKGAQ